MRFKGMILMLLVMSIATGAQAAKTLRWAGFTDATSMDPYNVNETFTLGFTGNIYDGLVTRGKDLSIQPALATSWTTPDTTTWIFNLRKGVKFHNGNAFTADDVVFSYNRVISEGSDMKANFASVESLTKKDDYTVVVKTKGANPILTAYMSTWYIMDKEWAEKNGATDVADIRKGTENHASRHANGTGPYKLVSRQADVKTELERNPDWWGWGKFADGNVDKVVFTPIKQDATRVAAILSNDVDFMYPVPVQDIGRLKKGGITVLQGPELRAVYLGLDIERDELLESNVKGKNPFKDPNVRLALYKAINVDAIVKKIMKGAATPAKGMVVEGVAGYDGKFQRMKYDPKAAKQLLAKAGYPKGFEIGFDCPNDRYVNDEQICQAVVSMWARVGVKAKLLAQTKSLYFKKALSRDTTAYLLGWAPGTGDGLNTLQNLIMTPNKEANEGRFNLGGYSNAKVDDLSKKAASEMDEKKRTKMLQDALNLAHKEVATIPLHYQQVIWGAKKGLSVAQRADNMFMIRWAKMK